MPTLSITRSVLALPVFLPVALRQPASVWSDIHAMGSTGE